MQPTTLMLVNIKENGKNNMEKAYRQLVRYSPFCKISIFIFPSLFKTLSEKNILSKPTNGITPM